MVGNGSPRLVARRKARDGEDYLEAGMNSRRFGTTPVPAPFLRHFLGEQKATRRRNRVQAETDKNNKNFTIETNWRFFIAKLYYLNKKSYI